MSKRQDDLRRLANDKSTTQGERDAARRALGEMPEAIESVAPKGIEQQARGLDVVRMQMPEWAKGEPGPHHEEVVRFGNRMFARGGSAHLSMRGFCADYNRYDSCDVTWAREEFVFKQYNKHVSSVFVVLGNERYEIYTTSYSQGWRDGPWWPRLFDLMRRWSTEADAYDAAEAREEAAKKQAQRDAENDLFTAYAKKCG